jgi:hypothetical protein
MSTILPIISLAAAVVGTTGVIDLKPTGYTSDPGFTNNKATLQLQNESGSGLQITTVKGQESTYIAAGGWKNLLLTPGESAVQYTVIYQLPNPGVTVLLAEFYRPGEPVIPPGTLGNSPVSIAQAQNVVNASNLINDGNTSQNIIESTLQSSSGSNVIMKNDGTFNLFQFVGGILTQLLAITPGIANGLANSNIIIGDANHRTEIVGALRADTVSQFLGTVTLTPSGGIAALAQNSNAGSGFVTQQIPNTNTGWTSFNSQGAATANNGIGFLASGNHQYCFDSNTINSATAVLRAGANASLGIDLSALTAATSGIKFAGGSLTRIAVAGPYTVTNVASFFNHNLGAIPDICIPVVGGNAVVTWVITWGQATSTATQVPLQASVASASPIYILSVKM